MAQFSIDQIKIYSSPATLMKCAIGLQAWSAQLPGSGQAELSAFCEQLCRYVMQRPDEIGLAELSADVVVQLGKLRRSLNSQQRAIERFSQALRDTLRSPDFRATAERSAAACEAWLAEFSRSPYHELAARALHHMQRAGIVLAEPRPFRDALIALTPPDRPSTGQYVPWLAAVALQIDAITGSPYPEVEFIETLLHEQVHAIIHQRMGDHGEHYRQLPWFNELTAIALSQYALVRAARDLGGGAPLSVMPTALRASRARQAWGDLASHAMRDMGDPLVLWRAWRAIFAHGSQGRRTYAQRERLQSTLGAAGWQVTFPYCYGEQSVDGVEDAPRTKN